MEVIIGGLEYGPKIRGDADYKSIAQMFSRLRQHHRMTLREVQEKTGLSQTVIARAESGHPITLVTACRLADVYAVEMNAVAAVVLREDNRKRAKKCKS